MASYRRAASSEINRAMSRGGWIVRAGLGGDGLRQAPNRGHRLTEFVVQLVRDQAPFLFDALVRQGSHFAPFLEPRLGIMRFALGQDLVLDGLRHAIERRADGVRFIAGKRRQTEAQIPLLDAFETRRDDRKGVRAPASPTRTRAR